MHSLFAELGIDRADTRVVSIRMAAASVGLELVSGDFETVSAELKTVSAGSVPVSVDFAIGSAERVVG